ncbi:MAG: sensor histidine kinase, partial [Planctomycetota bacterium]
IQSCLSVAVNTHTGQLHKQQADLISRARRRASKLASFVRELLTLTRMRLSNRLEMRAFSLKNTIENSAAAVMNKAQDKTITLTCNIQPAADMVLGNQLSIEESVTNMLINAVKYTPEQGKVAITARQDGDFVLVEVTDTGIGIPQEELPNIFDEFYRASNARSLDRDGTGLGLSIAKHIIERHGGQIEVESKSGEGTTFRFRLPRAASTPASKAGHSHVEPIRCRAKEPNSETYQGHI